MLTSVKRSADRLPLIKLPQELVWICGKTFRVYMPQVEPSSALQFSLSI